jgi:hypothetical protein
MPILVLTTSEELGKFFEQKKLLAARSFFFKAPSITLPNVTDPPGLNACLLPANNAILEKTLKDLLLADEETVFALGSAAAQLTRKERVIGGRVIYESLVKKHFNTTTAH